MALTALLFLLAVMSVCQADEGRSTANPSIQSTEVQKRISELKKKLIEAQKTNAPEAQLFSIIAELKEANQVAQDFYREVPGQNGELRPSD